MDSVYYSGMGAIRINFATQSEWRQLTFPYRESKRQRIAADDFRYSRGLLRSRDRMSFTTRWSEPALNPKPRPASTVSVALR
jgi:hypothetical protein